MIILDTNVISELMKPAPNVAVTEWISAQQPTKLAVSSIAIAEIQRGIFLLPNGKRRDNLQTSFTAFIDDAFLGRIFSFDENAAYIYGKIAASRKQAGYTVDAVDLMIAAIVKQNNASIATRNIKDFAGCEINIINPWSPTK